MRDLKDERAAEDEMCSCADAIQRWLRALLADRGDRGALLGSIGRYGARIASLCDSLRYAQERHDEGFPPPKEDHA